MNILDVLDPNLDLKKKYFVEASAGCGKTFAIENVYLRLLMDAESQFSIEDILVLTFTKEATLDLKRRIRASIQSAIFEIEDKVNSSRPFLAHLDKKNSKAISLALKEALANFDQAQIFTLHSFCYQMLKKFFLEAKLPLEFENQDSGPNLSLIETVVRDFFSFEFQHSDLSLNQLFLIKKYFKNDFKKLLRSCIQELSSEKHAFSLHKTQSLDELIDYLVQIKQRYNFQKELLEEDFSIYASQFKGTRTRSGEYKAVYKESIEAFIDLFFSQDRQNSIENFLLHAEAFFFFLSPENKKKKEQEKPLNYPSLLSVIHQDLQPLFVLHYSIDALFFRLINALKPLYLKTLEHQNLLTPQQLLIQFQNLIQNNEVTKQIAQLYQGVIVDEFQDTDDIQWDILNKIFIQHHSKNHPFFIVGDPKQSIYAFRDADIYTYLKAAKALGEENHYTLQTNYRSEPALIKALNDLFSYRSLNWFDLPKNQDSIAYIPINYAPKAKDTLKDSKASVHWMVYLEEKKSLSVPSKISEEHFFFPFMVNEIKRLNLEQGISYASIAILVRDRFQAARLKTYLSLCRLPYQAVRAEPIQGQPCVSLFLELFEATLYADQFAYLEKLFIHPYFFSETHLECQDYLFALVNMFSSLRHILFTDGMMSYFEALMSYKIEKESYGEFLLKVEGGLELYTDWQQIRDLCIEEEQKGETPFDLHLTLKKLSSSDVLVSDSRVKKSSLGEKAVHILTLHMSKGLEYDVVFPIGLMNIQKTKDLQVTIEQKGKRGVIPASYCSHSKQIYEKEINAEKLRQLYVAATRAKRKLYLPAYFQKDPSKDCSSPMSLFLNKKEFNAESLIAWVQEHPYMSYTKLTASKASIIEAFEQLHLTGPKSFNVSVTSSFCHSYSSLSKKKSQTIKNQLAPTDFGSEDKSIHTLPAGAQTGLLYHEIMQKIDFRADVDLTSFVKGSYYEPWQKVLEENIHSLLSMPIKAGDNVFCLKDLKPHQIHREIEFLYPADSLLNQDKTLKRGDYLTGYIDLICEYENQYYLFDYKTNWLGPSINSYQDLKIHFLENQYDLQASLYLLALKKYLKVKSQSDFEQLYGGCYYWFIRGLPSEDLLVNQAPWGQRGGGLYDAQVNLKLLKNEDLCAFQ